MLSAMGQCYLPGKMADNMHSHTKTDLITSCPVSVLFLPQLGEKIPWFLPFINKMSLPLTRHYVCLLYIYILYSPFSLNRTDVAAKQRCVTHNKRQDGIGKILMHFWGDKPKGNNNISNCPEICIVFCKMSSMSSVNYGWGCTASYVVPMLSK